MTTTTPYVATVWREVEFHASHQLPYHDGKCARPHGHNFKMRVSVTGPVQDDDPANPESGMVIDLAKLGDLMKTAGELYFDHHNINETTGILCPTSERLAWYVGIYAKHHIEARDGAAYVSSVSVQETDRSGAIVAFVGKGVESGREAAWV
jgi:6-pyruvoyltetrahydropterin/6-carboxytetrahydropterin synthase